MNPHSLKTYQKYLFLLLSLAYMLPFAQNVVMTVVAKDLMRELSLTPEGISLVGSVYLWGYAASILFSGMLAAYFGPRRFLAAMYLLSGLGSLVLSQATSLPMACLGRVMIGTGTAVVLASCLTLFGRWFRAEKYSGLCSAFFAIGGLGGLLGAAPIAVLNAAWGWRACYRLVAAETLFFSLMIFLTARDWPPAGAEKTMGLTETPRTPLTPWAMWNGIKTLSRSWDFWRLGAWFWGMSGVVLTFVGLWAAPFFKDVYGLSPARAGILISMFSFGFIVGNPFLSWVCDKIVRSNRWGLGMSGVVGLAAFTPFYLFGKQLDYPVLIGICLILGMALNSGNAPIFSSARNIFGSRLAGLGNGALACFSFISGAIMQVITGSILSYALKRGYSTESAYLLALAPVFPYFLLAIWAGATLSRDSDPGHVSASSWRSLAKPENAP